ncbi:MAG: hypothetical protein IJ416_08120 [Ruminiclostridium sp.]|nr:hypothetical protein [Ruminiclostridium sp.]
MMRNLKAIHILSALAVILLVITTLCGVLSWDNSKSFDAINQYGETIKMWGSGVYARDSYMKAATFIGSDMNVLVVGVPLTVVFLIKDLKNRSKKSHLLLVSVLAWVLYYAVSLCFGVTYNMLFLAYTALFICSFFAFITGIYSISKEQFNVPDFLTGKAYTIFLVLSGISTFIAWFPDIISSFESGTLGLIEVYTTEITYILDMGIISPAAFICLYLLKKRNSFGVVLLSVLTIGIVIVGTMMIFQTGHQIAAGIDIPVPVLITKSLIFLLLGIYAAILARKLYKNM